MRYFIACLGTETNSFSPLPTSLTTFADTMLCHGDGAANGKHILSEPLRVWRRRAEAHGIEIAESVSAFAEPAGPTLRETYEALRDEILDDLKAALPVDAVLLSLHGAMIAQGYPDTEGDLLTRIRAIVGPDIVVGAELDLHVHLTETMVEAATFLVPFKEYPHTDVAERAEEAFTICYRAVQGEVAPVMALTDTRINTYMPTTTPEMRGFVDRMIAMESEPGLLSVSLAHGFPHGDVADLTAKALVVADADPALAKAAADRVAADLWAIRAAVSLACLPLDEALDEALAASEGPVVIADTADNAGCGAPNDSTFILARMLERGIRDAAVSNIWDPGAVRFCIEAGEGATIPLRLGGKCGVISGDPVDLVVKVERIVEGASQNFNGFRAPMGDAVWVSGEGIDIVLNTKRFQTANPDMMTQLGLDPARRKIVVVKSTQHFYAGFASIAKAILYAATPGASNPDTTMLPYENVDRPFWPKVADPA
ncbi:M81 family metallopeptidase [Acuticoccus sp. M5D2P5]|uniref:M81 family metallopeptidase n=1 Tax=Acuticoccus kalidii TaxID=2910977 RepID=UPI001F2B7360|nr:M81 family metallopeptidase [Acuticoccus kalidii]MCF3933445.1 M81 family metallopeptidase [Acuticoccus kalidii]